MKPMGESFLQTWRDLGGEESPWILERAETVNSDLAPVGGGHWSLESEQAIAAEAARRFWNSPQQDMAAWQAVVIDFHRQGSWGHVAARKRPVRPATEAQKQRRELWPYVWALFQSSVIMKMVIYYFGINSAEEPTLFNQVGLGLGIAVSFGSLIFFAWRQARREKKQRGLTTPPDHDLGNHQTQIGSK